MSSDSVNQPHPDSAADSESRSDSVNQSHSDSVAESHSDSVAEFHPRSVAEFHPYSVAESHPKTVEEIFKDYSGRRIALITALTTDVEEFFSACDPEKENLSLYGYLDKTWKVKVPPEEVPPTLPEPVLGINFARDSMTRVDWLISIAEHCDSWLYALAFYYAATAWLSKSGRNELFSLMNDLPTVREVVSGRNLIKDEPVEVATERKLIKEEPIEGVTERKPMKDEPTTDSGSKSRSLKKSNGGHSRSNDKSPDESCEHNEPICESCRQKLQH